MVGQSLTFVNQSNGALGSDFISGDSFLLTITGAASDKPVTLIETKNGVLTTPTPWYAGTTTANGSFTLTGTETDYFVSAYTQQWYVDGQPIGPLQEFEVLYKPHILNVMGVPLTSFPSNCAGLTFGIFVDISYQVKNQTGAAVTTSTGVPLIPLEDVKFQSDPWVYDREIGGTMPGYPTSNRFLNDAGQFHDVPVGTCANYAFTYQTRQIISIKAGNNDYLVRGETVFTKSGPSAGHGSITNGSDVSATR